MRVPPYECICSEPGSLGVIVRRVAIAPRKTPRHNGEDWHCVFVVDDVVAGGQSQRYAVASGNVLRRGMCLDSVAVAGGAPKDISEMPMHQLRTLLVRSDRPIRLFLSHKPAVESLWAATVALCVCDKAIAASCHAVEEADAYLLAACRVVLQQSHSQGVLQEAPPGEPIYAPLPPPPFPQIVHDASLSSPSGVPPQPPAPPAQLPERNINDVALTSVFGMLSKSCCRKIATARRTRGRPFASLAEAVDECLGGGCVISTTVPLRANPSLTI